MWVQLGVEDHRKLVGEQQGGDAQAGGCPECSGGRGEWEKDLSCIGIGILEKAREQRVFWEGWWVQGVGESGCDSEATQAEVGQGLASYGVPFSFLNSVAG